MSIDVDDLAAKVSTGIYGDDRMTWGTIEAATTALSQLVAEVERLRGVNADLRLMVDGLETAAHEERAAVVAHLRERALHGAGNTIAVEAACTILADLFERGEHRRAAGLRGDT